MKKLIPLFLVLIFVLSFTGFAYADDNEKIVGEDIEIGENEAGIISIEEPDEYSENAKNGENNLISAPVVGDDISIGEEGVKIISIDNEDEDDGSPDKRSTLPLTAGISGGVLAIAFILMKLNTKF